jgi:hypothetical protein
VTYLVRKSTDEIDYTNYLGCGDPDLGFHGDYIIDGHMHKINIQIQARTFVKEEYPYEEADLA